MSIKEKTYVTNLGYYPTIELWSTRQLLEQLNIDELSEIYNAVHRRIIQLTGGIDGDKVRQLNKTASWIQRINYIKLLIDGKLIGVDKDLDKVIISIRGYGLNFRQLWPLYNILDCAYETVRSKLPFNERNKCKTLNDCICLPPGELTMFIKEINKVETSTLKQRLDRKLPSNETIISCLSKYYTNWKILQENHCNNLQVQNSNIGGKKRNKSKKKKSKKNKSKKNKSKKE